MLSLYSISTTLLRSYGLALPGRSGRRGTFALSRLRSRGTVALSRPAIEGSGSARAFNPAGLATRRLQNDVSTLWSVARAVLLFATLLLTACGSAPSKPDEDSAVAVDAQGAAAGGGADGKSTAARTTALPDAPVAGQPGAALSPAQQPVPKRAAADFDRAVGLMRSGDTTNAELEFKQLATGYPQFAAPQINLGLLQRKAGRLEDAEASLKSATERNPNNAVAWNELGVTLRMRGHFKEAADAYQHALTIDPNFAAAHRNLGVLMDLYLGDPETALTELERYKELTGEEKPVNGWIAELRQRTGKPPAPRPGAAKPAAAEPGAAPAAESESTSPQPAPADAAPGNPAGAQPPQSAPAASPPKAGEK